MADDMSAPRMGRRPFLIASIASLSVAAVATKCAKGLWTPQRTPAVDLTSYQPVFFDNTQWQFILAACDRLIPADDEGPGALETNVPVFIDRQMITPYGKGDDWYMSGPFDSKASYLFGYQMPFPLQVLYQKGIDLTNQYTQKQFHANFHELSADLQDRVLHDLDQNHIDFSAFGEKDLPAGYFFFRLLDNAKEGYLADPMYGGNKGMASWLMIDFPGARASFTEWVTMHNVKYPLKPVSLSGEQA
ncbi:gluconate 2-dehydrogenase subunit 3 family protein [Paraburkholderia sp. Ac-20340]|uniref:gluconate 2-dehydrogenase subunit 3 family protein n=1 Tax=Paraburkholderia sp. Ac-20340 TaxID=2703888 RepID=UPI001F1215FE|nr:gluconate 2-dehydrogenase subunit 3 family protein [Paraburkholderia sp. Ac-20340]MBN3853683.1 gluconate 2-dehydrogenase subunit 3 family protein [Paraburkholderia sp. Ac-20340]